MTQDANQQFAERFAQNRENGVTMEQVLESNRKIAEGGAPEVEAVQPAPAAKDKGETTPDQQNNQVDQLKAENERLESERKLLARTSSQLGERSKNAETTLLAAIAEMTPAQAQAFLSERPHLSEPFADQYPNEYSAIHGTSSDEGSVQEPVTSQNSAEPENVVVPETPKADKQTMKAEILDDLRKAAIDNEAESISENFALNNGLDREEQQRFKKVALAMTEADRGTTFEEALKSIYVTKFGKEPSVSSPTVQPVAAGGQKPQDDIDQESVAFMQNAFGFTGQKAIDVAKGAKAFRESATYGKKKK